MAVPVLVLAAIAALTALFALAERPSWLSWCPPWLSAVTAAVLGILGLWWAEPWAARRRSEADHEVRALHHLRRHLGRQDSLPRIGDASADGLALRVHPAIELRSTDTSSPDDAAFSARWWRRLTGQVGVPDLLDQRLPTFVERDNGPDIRGWRELPPDLGHPRLGS